MNAVAAPGWQSAFAACLLDPARPVPAGLRAPAGADPARRLAVHRNNVVAGLVAALAAGFPVVRRLVGATFFDAMAAEYLRAQPPRSPVLAECGDGFADWIERFAPASSLPWLADVARLERARVRAFHAADARALGTAEIAAQLADPAALPQARPILHPACSVIVSPFALAAIWAAHEAAADEAIDAIRVDVAQAALVLRDPADAVLVIPLAPAAGLFCQSLAAGATLGAAARAGAATAADGAADVVADPGLDLATTLGLLIRHGAIVGWVSPGVSS